MVKIIFILAVLIIVSEQANAVPVSLNSENFEREIFDYPLEQFQSSDIEKTNRARFYFQQTQAAVNQSNGDWVAADYWNLAVAFSMLNVPRAHIAISFQKAIDIDLPSVCSWAEMSSSDFNKQIPKLFGDFLLKCSEVKHKQLLANDDLDAYIEENGLDADLVKLVHQVLLNDGKYRSMSSLEKQAPYDIENQQIINELFMKYQRYIGRSLVAEELQYAMFLVIQHSDITMMEKYLSIVHDAVREGELKHTAPLKMLLDRIFFIKHGVQVFGSQGSVPIADDGFRQQVMADYPILL